MKKLNITLIILLGLLTISKIDIQLYRTNYAESQDKPPTLLDKIDIIATSNDVDPIIIQEIIRKETGFKNVIGDKNLKHKSYGMAQIRYYYHKNLCNLSKANELLDIDTNVQCASKVFKHYFNQARGSYTQKIKIALRRYNGGYTDSKASIRYANDVFAKIIQQVRYS